jgi:hypothetical protein
LPNPGEGDATVKTARETIADRHFIVTVRVRLPEWQRLDGILIEKWYSCKEMARNG